MWANTEVLWSLSELLWVFCKERQQTVCYSQTVFRISLKIWLMCVVFWLILCNHLLWVSPSNLLCCFAVLLHHSPHDTWLSIWEQTGGKKPYLQSCLWRELKLLQEQMNHSLPSLAYIEGNYFNLCWSTEHVLSTEHFHISVMFSFQKDVFIDQGDSLKFKKLQLHKIPCLQSNLHGWMVSIIMLTIHQSWAINQNLKWLFFVSHWCFTLPFLTSNTDSKHLYFECKMNTYISIHNCL